MIDAGLSAREIVRRMNEVGEAVNNLDGIVITHEHSDHIGGLRVLLNNVNCPVYISPLTADAYIREKRYSSNGEPQKRADAMRTHKVEIDVNKEFKIGEIDFEPFSVPHDAVDNFGFVAKYRGIKIASLTDFGHVTTLIKEKLRGCNGIMIESNHSKDMLKACPVYSWELKQRIASKHGHLANEDLADWLTNEYDGSARDMVLAHLSRKANEPHLAHLTATSALQMRAANFVCETEITLTHHKEPTRWFEY